MKDLGVATAAALVLDDDLIRRRATDRHRLARHQTEHVGPFRALTNDQICKHWPPPNLALATAKRPTTAWAAEARGQEVHVFEALLSTLSLRGGDPQAVPGVGIEVCPALVSRLFDQFRPVN